MKKRNKSRTALGVIGGMGPYADLEFLRILHEKTTVARESDHIPVLYDGNCLRPDRSSFIIGKSLKSPQKSLICSLKMLEREGASVIAMPCNTAHFWLPALKKAKKKQTRLIDMVTLVCKSCQKEGVSRVCVLSTDGTREADIFGERMFRMGLDSVTPDHEICKAVTELIEGVKRGEKADLSRLEPLLKNVDCEGFILGCSELSVAFHRTREPSFRYFDGLTVLAERAVCLCGASPVT